VNELVTMSIGESERNNDMRKNLLTTCRLVDNSRKTVYFTSYIAV
jgi:hypothetical protein